MKKVILAGLVLTGLMVGCGGGTSGDDNQQTVVTNENVNSVAVNKLAGHIVQIEEYDPIYKEVEFFCDGGYKLSTTSPYTEEPTVKYEYHTSMMHTEDDKLYLHYTFKYAYGEGNLTDRDTYSITLINNEIVVNDSDYNPGTYFEYSVTKITKIKNCN